MSVTQRPTPSRFARDAAAILVVARRPTRLESILRVSGAGTVTLVDDPRATANLPADLIVLDLDADETVDVLRELSDRGGLHAALAVAHDRTGAERALASGAKDVISPHDDEAAITARVRSLLETQLLKKLLTDASAVLEDRVRERTRELDEARREILDRLVVAAEYRDDDTRDHTRRVGETSALLAAAIGMSDEDVETIRLAAPLHDIGKIGVGDAILLKGEPLSDDEFEQVRHHPVIGGRILWGSHAPVLKVAQEIALFHHERWDGRGYPAGFAGDMIPLTARIVAVADVFDALTHERPYKKRWPIQRAMDELLGARGTQLEPRLVTEFQTIVGSGALDVIGWS